MPAKIVPEEVEEAPVKPAPNVPFIVLLTILLMLLVLFGLGLGVYYFRDSLGLGTIVSGKPLIDQPERTSSSDEAENPLVQDHVPYIPNSLTRDNLFYIEKNNIYNYDVSNFSNTKITDFPDSPDSSVHFISVADTENLGYGKCEIVVNDFGCALYLFDLKAGTSSLLKKIDPAYNLMAAGWANKNTFAYLISSDTKWKLILNKEGAEKTLADLGVGAYGRGGFYEDDEKISFSPDNKYVFHISTSSPRDSTDFSVHIYDTVTYAEKVINDATHPAWIDDSKIVYRKYAQSGGDGLWVYDVAANSSAKVAEAGSDTYKPAALADQDKFLFEDQSNFSVYLYDYSKKSNKLILANAAEPMWINDRYFAYSRVTACPEECGPMPFSTDYIGIYDLTEGKVVGTIPVITYIQGDSLVNE